jgi:hypothetical protein
MGSELTIDTAEQILKHNSHCPFVADQQSMGDSSVFAGVKAEQFVLSGGVPSAALQGQSRASAPLPEPHATCAPLEMRRFPVVRWPSPLCVPGAPVWPPTNRENLLPQFSIRFVSNSHRQVPIAPASSSTQIPAGLAAVSPFRPCSPSKRSTRSHGGRKLGRR